MQGRQLLGELRSEAATTTADATTADTTTSTAITIALFSGARLGRTLWEADNAYLGACHQQGAVFSVAPLQNNALKRFRPTTQKQWPFLPTLVTFLSTLHSTPGNQKVPGNNSALGSLPTGRRLAARVKTKRQVEEKGG